jgi:single-strand DNA-binding protein
MDVEAWNKTAENCHKYLEKGSQVALDGRLDLKQWQSKNGENKSKIFCVADSVHFLKKSNQQPQQAPKPQEAYEEEEDEVPF